MVSEDQVAGQVVLASLEVPHDSTRAKTCQIVSARRHSSRSSVLNFDDVNTLISSVKTAMCTVEAIVTLFKAWAAKGSCC
jgi:hypothetical protein